MIKNFLNSLEDPKRPLLGPNYWILKKSGLILNTKSEKIFWLILHELVLFYVMTQFVELYCLRANLDLALTNMKITMLSVVCVVKVHTYRIWHKNWDDILNYVTEADLYERKNSDEDRNKIINDYTKYCRLVTYGYWFFIIGTLILVDIQPLAVYLCSTTFRENYHNGTAPFPHIMSSWVPFDKEHPPGLFIVLTAHTLLSFYGAVIMAAYDATVVCLMVFFGGKTDLLRDRSRKIFKSLNPADIYKYVRELHTIHRLLLKYSKLFNSLLSPVMFFYIIMCCLALCANIFQITSAYTTTNLQKFLLAEYLLFGVVQLFIYCWHSNVVVYKSESLSMGPYESEWWLGNVKQRKYIMTLSGQFCIYAIYSAGPFTNLTLTTFITILKCAYSYYALLREV